MIKITGASDDLIEIEGSITEEFNSYDCKDGRLALSDGTLLKVQYDGIWRFSILSKGTEFVELVSGDYEADTNDEVHFKDGIKWVMFADEHQTEIKKSKQLG